MTNAIETSGLSRYAPGKGPAHVLADVNLTVPTGACLGLLGANGAGKSTLIKMLLGLAPIGAGRALLFDRPVPALESREGVGYLPENASTLPHLSGREHLALFAELAGLAGSARHAAVQKVLDDLGLGAAADTATGRYSKGMLQKLEIARVLMTPARLLILDEPMTGLDAMAQLELEDRLAALSREGVTLVITSHALRVLERLCNHFALIRRGRLVRSGPRAAMLRSEGFRIDVVEGRALPPDLPPAARVVADGRALVCPDRATADAALARLVAAQVPVATFTPVEQGIEDLLREAVS